MSTLTCFYGCIPCWQLWMKSKDIFFLVLCFGLMQIAVYYFSAAVLCDNGVIPLSQPDTLLYCQAARRIVEGHPFSFSNGTALSTGTTSVLYPFVLAIPYWLGCTGDALLVASFFLNALFYLITLTCWFLVARRVFTESSGCLLFSLSLSLFGPLAFCAFSQTDIGMWMAFSAVLVCAFVAERRAVYAPLLILAPWIRPEGMMLVLAFGIIRALRATKYSSLFFTEDNYRSPKHSNRAGDLSLFVLGVASCIGVFAFNYAITGEFQFASLRYKGYFSNYPLPQAIYATVIDGLTLVKCYMLGLSSDAPRILILMPLISGVMAICGIAGRFCKERFRWGFLVYVLAISFSFMSVATSGWQGKNLDRYLAWTWPVLIVFIVDGCFFVGRMFRSHKLSRVILSLHVVFFSLMSVVFACLFHMTTDSVERRHLFAKHCETLLPSGCDLGSLSGAGFIYDFSSRKMASLSGVYSPEFLVPSMASTLEVLKREPQTRFSYFLYNPRSDTAVWSRVQSVVMPNQVAVGPDGWSLRTVDWAVFDAAEEVPPAPQSDVKLVDRVDVGYLKEELSHEYRCLTRYNIPEFETLTILDKLGEKTIVEGGRLIVGADEMRITVSPHKDVYVVMRTYPECRATYAREINPGSFDFSVSGNINIEISVNGESLGLTPLNVSPSGFSDVAFKIPHYAIKESSLLLSLSGEHIACGYWFYQ